MDVLDTGIEYVAKDGEFIDQICFRHYGFVDGALEAVCGHERNRSMIYADEELPGGTKIFLPKLVIEGTRLTRLWE